jgi:uncharacterized protein (TIGR03437 family)
MVSGTSAVADDMAYMITTPCNCTQQFGTVDLNTGAYTPIGNLSESLEGLGVAGGKLYGAGANYFHSQSLYEVNLANGGLTDVGSSSIYFTAFGSTLNGLYATDGSGYLYSIDPATGASTAIGNGLLPQCGTGGGMSTNSATLYLTCGTSLYTVNVTNGTPTLVGTIGDPLPDGDGSVQVNALTFINGTLYGGINSETSASAAISINPTDAAAGPPAQLQGAYGFYGLAPIIPNPAPTINPGGVVPNYGFTNSIEAGSWVSIYGSNFAGSTSLWTGDFPISLGGVSVTIDNKPAYLYSVGPTQINVQAPDDSTIGTVSVVVTNAAGSATSTVTLSQYAPSFSLFLGNKYAAAEVQNASGGVDFIGPAGAFSFPSRPVKAGEIVELYGVGFGPTNPAVPAGEALSVPYAPSVILPQVKIGGLPATVTFAGISEPGTFQINVVIPDAGSGDQLLEASVGGATTQSGVYITLQ